MAVYKGIVKPNKYNFNAVAKTITFDAEYTGLEISDILTIHNVVDNIEIYNFTNPLKGGTLVGLVLTLTFDTTTMSNTDDLTIVVGANDLAIPVVGTVTVDTSLLATATKQDTGNISLSNLDSNIGVQTDISATTDTGTFSLISLFKRALTKLTSILSTQTDGSQKTKITDGSGTVNTKQLGNPITNVDVGLITNTVIHGQTTGGGGGYVDVKVNPSGALTVESTITSSILPTGASTLAEQQTQTTKLTSIDGKDFATETTLDAVKTAVENLDTKLINPLPVIGNLSLGVGDIQVDAWGIPKMSLVRSLDHGLFTFDISPLIWFMYHNNTQVYTSTNITSVNGEAIVTGNAGVPIARLESRLCPRYQPNRGHLFSTAVWMPLKTNDGIRNFGLGTDENRVHFRLKADGKLYAVLKSNNIQTYEQEIDTSIIPGFDVEKGNVYDIQYQWRGVGNYKFFINLTLVHTISNLGTLTSLSLANPALPQFFESIRTTQDVSMYIGCADTSSENGTTSEEQFTSAYAQAVTTTGVDKPILVIRNPLQIGGKTNTRTIVISNIKVTSDKKCIAKVWRTRNPANITGATYVANGNGSYVETDSTNMNAGAVRATAVTVANLNFVTAMNLETNVSSQVLLSVDREHMEFSMVRGDYLIITNDATTGTATCVVDWGEEI